MISNSENFSVFQKVYKTTYEFANPLLKTLAIICAILCLFSAQKGSNSRIICFAILIVSVLVIGLMRMTHDRFEKQSYAYRLYRSRITTNFNPRVTIPLCVMFLLIVFPFYILVVTSIKTPLEAMSTEFTWWPKDGVDLQSFAELFSQGASIGVTMGRAILNSFVYAIVPTLIGVFAAALSAYAFAKLKFPGRDLMYQILIMTMMMPGCVTMTTSYIMYDWYGWTNSSLPIIVPACFSAAATVMFMREYFMGVPDGLLEAAKIDGAGKWKAFILIMIPLGKPAIIAQIVLGFISKYNDFLAPLIYLNNPSKYTIQVALDFLNNASMDKSLIATAALFGLVPMLLIYVAFQKLIIGGISMSSGLKG